MKAYSLQNRTRSYEINLKGTPAMQGGWARIPTRPEPSQISFWREYGGTKKNQVGRYVIWKIKDREGRQHGDTVPTNIHIKKEGYSYGS